MLLLVVLVAGVLTGLFALGAIYGAPYLPSRDSGLKAAFKLLDLKPGQKLLDIGVGSGTVLVMAAQKRIYSIGYEINPIMFLVAKYKTKPYRQYATVKLGNYWKHPLPPVDGVYAFLITKYMAKLDQKLASELIKSTPVVSFGFNIKSRRAVTKIGNVYLYRYP